LRRSSRCGRSDVSLYCGHPLRGVHECQGSDALTGTPSREALAPVFAELNKYHATTHFVGQSTIFTLTGDPATGEAYCLAHHVTVNGGKRRLMLASLRYFDTFVKIDGSWLLFAERCLYVDWLEERALS
jgi:SnoaL-like domain